MSWPGPHTDPGSTRLRARNFEPVDARRIAKRSSSPSTANCAWLAPKPRNVPYTESLVRAAKASTSIVGNTYGPPVCPAAAFEHLHADRRVRPGVSDDARL